MLLHRLSVPPLLRATIESGKKMIFVGETIVFWNLVVCAFLLMTVSIFHLWAGRFFDNSIYGSVVFQHVSVFQ